ncbi:glycosyltransferase family 2 protein [Herbidospora galbida]|uniref:dolichyl-phosphate beta-glucosyltransferase n=1 Tax=Herbidospora galbida TaxID=2575442 RepID=A0A4U3LXK5_9ACTN|nr:dolichyl-phosphate beta-glucosyltransferase [Herbidospora galbida]TKK80911.1 glycosyltransferase family 2 protein [Herbidospora galbida]
MIEIVLPVYNEERVLASSVSTLLDYLKRECPFPAQVTVADNGSTDATWSIARSLDDVRTIRLESKGRGLALREAWSWSQADVVAYMDVDLSTDLAAFLPLVGPLLAGECDVAVGSRLAPGSSVVRGPRRELISRTYNRLLRSLGATFTDAQCGFKALRTPVARELLPHVADDAWFFDTELLLKAQWRGLRIREVPVRWVDDPDSSVDVLRTSIAQLRGLARVVSERDRGVAAAAWTNRHSSRS